MAICTVFCSIPVQAEEIEENADIDDGVETETAPQEEGVSVRVGNIIASGNWGGNIEWVLTDDGMLILSGTGIMEDHMGIGPSGPPIGHYLSYCDLIKNVVIEEGITNIGERAFHRCKNMTGIKMPNSINSIGASAFFGCSSLTEITIPDSVVAIDYSAFEGCGSLEKIRIPEGVKNIRGFTFSGCGNLKEVILPDSVESIGPYTFWHCRNLEKINIPASVCEIEGRAFSDCSSLTEIHIPEGMEQISRSTFHDCTSLNRITLPDSLTSIADKAFINCSNLKTITIPDSVTEIGGSVFSGCSSLEEIKLPNGVASIEYDSFYGCTSLPAVTIPASVTSIGKRAFSGCSSLTGITIPENVTTIEYDAFYACTSLPEITIPASVTKIGGGAFGDCTALTTVYFLGNAPEFDTDREGGEDPLEPFANVTADVYYPYGNETWTPENMLDYGGTLNWLSRNPADDLRIIPEITDEIFVIGSPGGAVIKCSGALEDFVSIAIDGKILDPSYYTAKSGSTVITILSAYLNSLAVGEHVVTLNYTYGSVDTILTVVDSGSDPKPNPERPGYTYQPNPGRPEQPGGADKTGNDTGKRKSPKTGEEF